MKQKEYRQWSENSLLGINCSHHERNLNICLVVTVFCDGVDTNKTVERRNVFFCQLYFQVCNRAFVLLST